MLHTSPNFPLTFLELDRLTFNPYVNYSPVWYPELPTLTQGTWRIKALITEAELRQIDCDEEFVFAAASPEARLERLRLLQRTIAENQIRIGSMQRLYRRAYELATAEEREKLRTHDADFSTLPDATKVNDKLTEEQKILNQLIAMGKDPEAAKKFMAGMGMKVPE